MTPACLQSLYNIPSAPATSKDNGIAVTAYEYEWPTYSDLSVSRILAIQRKEVWLTSVPDVLEGSAPGYGPEHTVHVRIG